MKKIHLTYVILFFLQAFISDETSAQNNFDISEINQAAKAQFIQPAELDRLLILLRTVENGVNQEQEAMLIETYRTISDQYVANNHYSQAYQVYSKAMNWKQEFAERNFHRKIDSTNKAIEQRRANDGTELMNLQNQVQELQIDNDLLVSNRINFKKYFSFVIIALSSLFALILVRSAMKLFRIRSQLKENKEVMQSNHRISTLGGFAKGLVNQSRQKASIIEDMAQKLHSTFQKISSSDQSSSKYLTDIRSECKEIIKELNSSGIEA